MKQPINTTPRVSELTARYGSDDALGVCYDEELQLSLLPNGGYAASCGDCAYYIQSCEPNTQVVGFWSRDNPSWVGADLQDGHDFALVDNRHIVDPWIVETEHFSARAVFDLYAPADQIEIRRLYGDRTTWQVAAD